VLILVKKPRVVLCEKTSIIKAVGIQYCLSKVITLGPSTPLDIGENKNNILFNLNLGKKWDKTNQFNPKISDLKNEFPYVKILIL